MANPQKIDSIRDRFFLPLEVAEKATDAAFYVAAALSIVVLFVDKSRFPQWYEVVQLGFLLFALASFFLGLAMRIYWNPRAQDQRIRGFLSTAFDVRLTAEQTRLYYNNQETESFRKIVFQLLENSFFSKEIARRMCKTERIRLAAYLLIWLGAMAFRATPLDLVVVVSQVVFSEQLLSRFFRLEWLRMSFERVYDSTYQLAQMKTNDRFFQATAICNLVSYECSKANGAITLSPQVFERLNAELSSEWEKVRTDIQ